MRRLGLTLALLLWPGPGHAQAMPQDFVFLASIDPSIQQDIRYAGPFNFTGAPVPGYRAGECILHRAAAEGLRKAQAAAKNEGVSLKVLDCYRPQKATRAFMAWVDAPGADAHRQAFHPGISKAELVARGFISAQSGHSLGIALDVTLVRAADPPVRTTIAGSGACNGALAMRTPESGLDLGTTFDCFAQESRTQYKGLSNEARRNRALLLTLMESGGFRNYAKEWWHFQLSPAPSGLTAQDFDIVAR